MLPVDDLGDVWTGAEVFCRRLASDPPHPDTCRLALELRSILADVRALAVASASAPRPELGRRALEEMERLYQLGVEVSRADLAHEQRACVQMALVLVRALLQALVDAAREGWSASEIRELLQAISESLLAPPFGGRRMDREWVTGAAAPRASGGCSLDAGPVR